MTGTGSTPRTGEGLLRDWNKRITALERRRVLSRLQAELMVADILPEGRLGPYAEVIADPNDLITTGFAQVGSALAPNRPTGSSGSLQIQSVALVSGSVFQVATEHGAVGAGYGDQWERDLRDGAGWGEWHPTRLRPRNFTPTVISGLTVGNGTWNASRALSGDLAIVSIQFTLGSTSAVTGDIRIAPPFPPHAGTTASLYWGAGRLQQSGALLDAITITQGGGADDILFIRPKNAAGTYVSQVSASATVPFTWASGNGFQGTWIYPIR